MRELASRSACAFLIICRTHIAPCHPCELSAVRGLRIYRTRKLFSVSDAFRPLVVCASYSFPEKVLVAEAAYRTYGGALLSECGVDVI